MPTFTDLLPASKSNPHRVMKYTPACKGVGLLELTDARTHVRYALTVQPFGGVRLTKSVGDENYVTTATGCECRGFVFSKTGQPCKHIEAVRTLLANGWLAADGRETVTDVAAEAEDRDAYYADAFENHDGPDRLADDEHADSLGRTILQEPLPC